MEPFSQSLATLFLSDSPSSRAELTHNTFLQEGPARTPYTQHSLHVSTSKSTQPPQASLCSASRCGYLVKACPSRPGSQRYCQARCKCIHGAPNPPNGGCWDRHSFCLGLLRSCCTSFVHHQHACASRSTMQLPCSQNQGQQDTPAQTYIASKASMLTSI
jgi:hypothetical protein